MIYKDNEIYECPDFSASNGSLKCENIASLQTYLRLKKKTCGTSETTSKETIKETTEDVEDKVISEDTITTDQPNKKNRESKKSEHWWFFVVVVVVVAIILIACYFTYRYINKNGFNMWKSPSQGRRPRTPFKSEIVSEMSSTSLMSTDSTGFNTSTDRSDSELSSSLSSHMSGAMTELNLGKKPKLTK